MKRYVLIATVTAASLLRLHPAHAQEAREPEGTTLAQPDANAPPPLPSPSAPTQTPPVRDETPARTASAPKPVAYPCWPPEIEDFNEEKPVPAGYTKVTRVRRGMLYTGIPIWAGFYALSILTSIAGVRSGDSAYGALVVPVAGPFITSALENERDATAILFFLGLGQVTGATLTTLGFLLPKHVLVREELAKGSPRLTLQPLVAPNMTGLAGTF
jgi:hypothetical protein